MFSRNKKPFSLVQNVSAGMVMPGGATLRNRPTSQVIISFFTQVWQLRTQSGKLNKKFHLNFQQPNMGVPQMMRLSSISSQDSGFTSQDTLFLRPGSPGMRGKVRGGKRRRHLVSQ